MSNFFASHPTTNLVHIDCFDNLNIFALLLFVCLLVCLIKLHIFFHFIMLIACSALAVCMCARWNHLSFVSKIISFKMSLHPHTFRLWLIFVDFFLAVVLGLAYWKHVVLMLSHSKISIFFLKITSLNIYSISISECPLRSMFSPRQVNPKPVP